jgi:nicotinate-nucleotide adenylyltransferase
LSLLNFIQSHHLSDQKELVFFGGSFNPWHEGHSECLRLLQTDIPVIVIPDHNPYKELITDKDLNLDKLRDKISGLRKNTYLYTGFFDKNTKNPTAYWIKDLKQSLPQTKLSLLMGFDTFNALEKWIDAKELINNLSSLYIASRLENEEHRHKQIDVIHRINSNLLINFLGKHKYEDLSSTQIRENK